MRKKEVPATARGGAVLRCHCLPVFVLIFVLAVLAVFVVVVAVVVAVAAVAAFENCFSAASKDVACVQARQLKRRHVPKHDIAAGWTGRGKR